MTLVELEALSWAWLSGAVGFVIRTSVLAGLCALAAWISRSRSAELRHSIWRGMLVSLLLMPFLLLLIPPVRKTSKALSRVEIAVLPVTRGSTATVTSSYSRARLEAQMDRESAGMPTAWLPFVIFAVYGLIVAVQLARLAYSKMRLHAVLKRRYFIADRSLHEALHQIWLENGACLRPQVAASSEISVPITFNDDQPWILLPANWSEWTSPKLQAVLMHEMAHIRRGDAHTALLAALCTSIFWFHPLA